MSDNKKSYSNPPRQPDKSFMDTITEVYNAITGGARGAARNRANPASEASRAQNRTEQREGKAYGGRTKKMCGGKAHGKKK